MGKLLLSVILILFAVNVFSQQIYETFDLDTVKGDTLINAVTDEVKYNGFITFDYTFAGYATDDTLIIDFQGSNDDGTTWQTLQSDTLIEGTSAANQHYVDNPAEYLLYRMYKRAYAVTDTAIFSNKTFIFKR